MSEKFSVVTQKGPLYFLKLVYIIYCVYTYNAIWGKMCRAKGFNIQEELDDCTHENLNLYRDIDFLNFVYKSIGSFVRYL